MNENIVKRNELLAAKVIKGLESRNMSGYYAENKEEALKIALGLIPEGSSIGMGDCAKITVADNGPGVPDEEKEQVFAMFYSGSRKVTDSKRSLGLGLALCRSIVRAHGCEIMLDDNMPHGCIFSFTLPMKEVTLHD